MTISLPIYQILETPSSGPDVQYPGNRKRGVIVDELGGGETSGGLKSLVETGLRRKTWNVG